MSSVTTPRPSRTASCWSPKSSPAMPTILTSVKKLAASEKWTAEPPSIRSRFPNGVRTESNAIEPTTVSDIAGWRVGAGTYPSRVKAIQIEEFGGPELLKPVEVPDPEPSDGEVMVDVARAGMNFADTHAIRNDYLA